MPKGRFHALRQSTASPVEELNKYLDQNKDTINTELGNIAKSLGEAADGWVKGIGHIDWTAAEHGAKNFADEVAHLVKEFADFSQKLSDNLPMLEALLGAAGGSAVGSRFGGPLGALLESDSSGHSADTGGFWGGVWGGVKRFFGGSSGPGSQVTPPGPPGTYRPQYSLSAKDLSDAVVNTIAGEASTKDPAAIDAVINNMFNRLGSHGYGPSGNLEEIARAPGQYTGYRQASPDEAKMIRDRIRAVASGGVADNTHGSMEYRGAWLYYPFKMRHPEGVGVGGNWFFPTTTPEGPYGAYPTPRLAAKPAPALGSAEAGTLDWSVGAPGWAAINAALPVGAAGAPAVSGKPITVSRM